MFSDLGLHPGALILNSCATFGLQSMYRPERDALLADEQLLLRNRVAVVVDVSPGLSLESIYLLVILRQVSYYTLYIALAYL